MVINIIQGWDVNPPLNKHVGLALNTNVHLFTIFKTLAFESCPKYKDKPMPHPATLITIPNYVNEVFKNT